LAVPVITIDSDNDERLADYRNVPDGELVERRGIFVAEGRYRKAIRTSMGAALLVPFARAEPWPDALRHLRDLGFASVALTPSADAAPLRDAVAQLAERQVAVVLGHEGDGLTREALEACEHHARIPMSGFDSLNVASAAAIALYELRRAGYSRPPRRTFK